MINDFDGEERSLKKEEKFNRLIVDFDGDVKRAKQKMGKEESNFETHKDFARLLTDAAMRPESSQANISTQKFAIALSKEWIRQAYNDVTAANRMKIPNEIEIKVGAFTDVTTDGQNEKEILDRYNLFLDGEKLIALSQNKFPKSNYVLLFSGCVFVIAAICGLWMAWLWLVIGVILLLAFAGAIGQIKTAHRALDTTFGDKRKEGTDIICALMAEVVDFRAQFNERDSESKKVTNFLDEISIKQITKKVRIPGKNIRPILGQKEQKRE